MAMDVERITVFTAGKSLVSKSYTSCALLVYTLLEHAWKNELVLHFQEFPRGVQVVNKACTTCALAMNIKLLLYSQLFHCQVVSVNFRPFFRNENKPIKKEKFYTNYINVDFPENIFTHGSDTINEVSFYIPLIKKSNEH